MTSTFYAGGVCDGSDALRPRAFRGGSTDLLDRRFAQLSASVSQKSSFSPSIFARWLQNAAIAR